MALPLILTQPRNDAITSTITSIPFRVSESSADTINIIATVEYNDGSSWVQWGGIMRCAPRLDYPTYYQLNIADLVNSLPVGRGSQVLSGLTIGDCWHTTPMAGCPQTYWKNISNWNVRVKFQREYLDAATGLIELDPDQATSNEFYVHQGAPPLRNLANENIGYLASVNGGQFDPWVHQQNPTNRRNKFLFMTDSPLIKRFEKWQYEFKCREDENLFLSCWNGTLIGIITLENRIQIQTFSAQSGVPLNTHIISWTAFGGFDSAGFMSINVGMKCFRLGGLTPNAAEGSTAGSLFENVDYYVIHNLVSNTTNTARTSTSMPVKVTVDRTCRNAGYQRFLWRNQLGAYDMFSSKGMVTTQSKTVRSKFEKRVDMFSQFDPNEFGSENWLNVGTQQYKVDTHDLENHEVELLKGIMNSPEVYIRVPFYDDKGYNLRAFNTDEYNGSWFDDNNCYVFVPIVITTTSFKQRKTTENMTKVRFQYQWANKERYPRN